MNRKEFFTIVLPFFIIVYLLKLFLSSLFLVYPGDMILAFALAVSIFRDSKVILYTFLFFLGLLESLNFSNIEIFSAIYFVFLGVLINYLRKYFTFETIESKIFVWIFNIIGALILRYLLLFYNLNVSINWIIISNLAIKGFYYFFMTFIWVLVFYKILTIFYGHPQIN